MQMPLPLVATRTLSVRSDPSGAWTCKRATFVFLGTRIGAQTAKSPLESAAALATVAQRFDLRSLTLTLAEPEAAAPPAQAVPVSRTRPPGRTVEFAERTLKSQPPLALAV